MEEQNPRINYTVPQLLQALDAFKGIQKDRHYLRQVLRKILLEETDKEWGSFSYEEIFTGPLIAFLYELPFAALAYLFYDQSVPLIPFVR